LEHCDSALLARSPETRAGSAYPSDHEADQSRCNRHERVAALDVAGQGAVVHELAQLPGHVALGDVEVFRHGARVDVVAAERLHGLEDLLVGHYRTTSRSVEPAHDRAELSPFLAQILDLALQR